MACAFKIQNFGDAPVNRISKLSIAAGHSTYVGSAAYDIFKKKLVIRAFRHIVNLEGYLSVAWPQTPRI